MVGVRAFRGFRGYQRLVYGDYPYDLLSSTLTTLLTAPTCILADIDRGSLQAADAYGALLGLLRSSRLVRLGLKKVKRCRPRRLVA